MLNILLALLPELLGLLGRFLASFIQNSQAAGLDPNLMAVIRGYVVSAEANGGLANGDAKWEWVYDQMMDYLKAEGKVMAKSMLNAAIEMAVQDLPSTLAKFQQPAAH